MTTIPHRELRNQSSKILERVKNGETIDVTNNGEIAATLIPPSASPFERLLLAGQVRPAAKGPVDFLALPAAQGHQLVASMLLYTELHCAAHRRGLPGEPVNTVLGAINLVDLARSDLMYAAALPGKLRSAGAIHLAAAIRLQSDVMVAYDAELLAAAVEAGLNAVSPGG